MIHKQYKLLFCLFAAFSLRAEQAEQSEFNLIKEEQDISRKPSPYVTAGQIAGGSNASSTDLANVSEGGTGHSSLTANALLAGGVTATSPLQSLGTGTAGQLLISNGSAAVPTFQTLSTNVRVFTTAGAGTYTPTSGTQLIIVEAIAGGGGSGAVGATTLVQSAGGGSGSYSRRVLTAGQIGTAIAYTVGAGGFGGLPYGGTSGVGKNGEATTFGATLVTTNGGIGSAAGGTAAAAGGAGGALGTGGVFAGLTGQSSILATIGGAGANAPAGFGQGGYATSQVTGGLTGIDGQGFGSGASGSTAGTDTPTAKNGGTGAPGAIIITEYILAA